MVGQAHRALAVIQLEWIYKGTMDEACASQSDINNLER